MVTNKGNATKFLNDIIKENKRKEKLNETISYYILNAYPFDEINELQDIIGNGDMYKELDKEKIDILIEKSTSNKMIFYFLNTKCKEQLNKEQIKHLVDITPKNQRKYLLIRSDLTNGQIINIIKDSESDKGFVDFLRKEGKVSNESFAQMIGNLSIKELIDIDYVPLEMINVKKVGVETSAVREALLREIEFAIDMIYTLIPEKEREAVREKIINNANMDKKIRNKLYEDGCNLANIINVPRDKAREFYQVMVETIFTIPIEYQTLHEIQHIIDARECMKRTIKQLPEDCLIDFIERAWNEKNAHDVVDCIAKETTSNHIRSIILNHFKTRCHRYIMQAIKENDMNLTKNIYYDLLQYIKDEQEKKEFMIFFAESANERYLKMPSDILDGYINEENKYFAMYFAIKEMCPKSIVNKLKALGNEDLNFVLKFKEDIMKGDICDSKCFKAVIEMFALTFMKANLNNKIERKIYDKLGESTIALCSISELEKKQVLQSIKKIMNNALTDEEKKRKLRNFESEFYRFCERNEKLSQYCPFFYYNKHEQRFLSNSITSMSHLQEIQVRDFIKNASLPCLKVMKHLILRDIGKDAECQNEFYLRIHKTTNIYNAICERIYDLSHNYAKNTEIKQGKKETNVENTER